MDKMGNYETAFDYLTQNPDDPTKFNQQDFDDGFGGIPFDPNNPLNYDLSDEYRNSPKHNPYIQFDPQSNPNIIENRMGDGDGDWTKPYNAVIDENNYMQGCAMGSGRILRKMEVLVNGQAVLCCDDAEGKTNYGNIFEIGIEGAWKTMQKEHKIIYDKKYSEAKKNLICNTCSRAKFNNKWTPAMESRLNSVQQDTINRIGSMQ